MKKISTNVKEVLKSIEHTLNKSSDLNSRFLKLNNKRIMYCFMESVSSDDKISSFFMRSLSQDIKRNDESFIDNLFNNLENTIPNSKINIIKNYDDIFFYLANGFTCIFVDGHQEFLAIETKADLDRGVTEGTSEAIIRGPKDSFTENHMTNLGLIRKRIKDPHLWMEDVSVGRRTKTKVTIAYIEDIAPKENIKKIKKRLSSIDIDGILDSGYLLDFLSPRQKSSFPKSISTERPDYACMSLLNGRICIFVENSPFILILPAVMLDFLKSPEDNYQKPLNSFFTRLTRLLAFFITIFTPALYIAVMTYNQEIIPYQLLMSLSIQRQGVPFPTVLEVLILSATFEILRESDIRIPKVTGTSISVVGALVLGDAAVSAGIVSPFVVIIVAITSICSLVFTDADFINAIRGWRLFFIICATFMGILGIFAGFIIMIAKVVSIESLGTPYLSPISPLNFNDQKGGIFRKPRNKQEFRPSYIKVNNQRKLRVKKDEK